MKVTEKDTDRTAEVHLCVDGKMPVLEEYGEYISSKDNAICCYVPVDEGHLIKIKGNFAGTTYSIAYDAVVDGVFRKTTTYTARDVHHQKNKKIEVETFLYKNDKGIIDTDMLVTKLPEGIAVQEDEGIESIGTVELRLYITRQLDVSHTLGGVEKYYAPRNNIDDEVERTACYNQIAPTYQMRFEPNSAPLEKGKVTREKGKLNAPRPGTGPWAIFRFHYRSKDAILSKDMKLTFNPHTKAKFEARTLMLDPVPPLVVGAKPPKDDGDSSTRASSPMPPDLPSTPVKAAQKESASQSTTYINKQQNMPTIPTNTMATVTEDISSTLPDEYSSPGVTTAALDEESRARASPKPSLEPSTKATHMTQNDKPAPEREINGDNSRKAASDIISYDKVIEKEHEKPTETDKNAHLVDKPTKKDVITDKDTIAVVIPKAKTAGSTEASATKGSNIAKKDAKPTNGNADKTAEQSNGIVKKPARAPRTPSKEQRSKPMPINTSMPVAQKSTAPPPTPVTPTKRPLSLANGTSPKLKRAKIDTTPPQSTVPITPYKGSQVSVGSPSPRPMSIERQVAEQRKKLETLRKKRLEIATKQVTVDKEMAPYKERMAEELERLNAEMLEEENAYVEEEQHYSASLEILTEFKKMEDDA